MVKFKKMLRRHVFFTSIFLLIFVFIGGILLGRAITKAESDNINDFIKENELNTESYLVEQDMIKFFDDNNCELAEKRINSLSNELADIGRSLTPEDAKDKLGEENYNFLKRKFHLMQIKTYILFKKLIDQCDIRTNIILYYYSTGDLGSANQGIILDDIVIDYDTKVFAIEYNYSEELVFLETYYNITETPTIIIDYNNIYSGLTDYDTIAEEIQ